MSTEIRELPADEAEQVMVTEFGALSLVPMEQDEFKRQLARAGFTVPTSARSASRADEAFARAGVDNAHRIEVNERSTNNLGLWA